MGGVSASAAHPVHPGEGHMLPPARGAFVHPDPVPRIYGTAGPGAYLSSGPLPPRAPRADVADPAIAGIDPRFDPAYAGIDPRFVGHGGFAHTGIPVRSANTLISILLLTIVTTKTLLTLQPNT